MWGGMGGGRAKVGCGWLLWAGGGVLYCTCAFVRGGSECVEDVIQLHCSSAVKHLCGAAAAAACREEQKQMQRAAGVASFGDINQLLSTAPRDVVELLRIAGGCGFFLSAVL